jgi:hypothetical protein
MLPHPLPRTPPLIPRCILPFVSQPFLHGFVEACHSLGVTWQEASMNRPPVLDTDRCSEQDVFCFHAVQPYLAGASFCGLHASFSGRLLRYFAVANTLAPKVSGLGFKGCTKGLRAWHISISAGPPPCCPVPGTEQHAQKACLFLIGEPVRAQSAVDKLHLYLLRVVHVDMYTINTSPCQHSGH